MSEVKLLGCPSPDCSVDFDDEDGAPVYHHDHGSVCLECPCGLRGPEGRNFDEADELWNNLTKHAEQRFDDISADLADCAAKLVKCGRDHATLLAERDLLLAVKDAECGSCPNAAIIEACDGCPVDDAWAAHDAWKEAQR